MAMAWHNKRAVMADGGRRALTAARQIADAHGTVDGVEVGTTPIAHRERGAADGALLLHGRSRGLALLKVAHEGGDLLQVAHALLRAAERPLEARDHLQAPQSAMLGARFYRAPSTAVRRGFLVFYLVSFQTCTRASVP